MTAEMVPATLTVPDGRRIDRLLAAAGLRSSPVGPRYDPYMCETADFAVTAALARLLMRKGLLRDGQEVRVVGPQHVTSYFITVARAWESARYRAGHGARRWTIRRITL